MKQILIVLLLVSSFAVSAQHKDLNKLFSKGKFEKVIEQAVVRLEKSPDDAILNMIIGRAHASMNRYQTAIPFLQKGVEAEEQDSVVKSWCLAEMGNAYYYTGQREKGLAYLKKAIDMQATRSCSRFAQNCLKRFQENKYFQKWKVRETEHLRFHFQDESVVDNVEKYIAQHEKAYQVINQFFKAELGKKIDFFVWKDREEAYDVLGRPLGFANSERKIINVWYKQTKGYEICHIICDVAIQPKKKSLLINEGICVYLDQTIHNKMDAARQVLPKGEFHLLELWESPTHYERDLSYPMGGAFIDFLINKAGRGKIILLLKDQTIENAEKIYPDFKNLVKVFEAMLEG